MFCKRNNENEEAKIAKILRRISILYPFILKLGFEYLYITQFSVRWGYLGATADPDLDKFLVSWLMFGVFTITIKVLNQSKIASFYKIFYYFSIIPSLSIYWLKNEDTTAFIIINVYWFLWFITTFLVSYVSTNNGNKTYKVKIGCNDKFMTIINLWVLISTLYFSYRYGAFRLFINFNDVYTYRLSGNNMSTLGSYLFSWNVNLLLPLCLIIHLINKKFILAGIYSILFLFSFSIYGNKSIFFVALLTYGIWILTLLRTESHTDTMIAAFLAFTQVFLIITKFGWGIALDDRLLEGPAAGHYNYYDFFKNNELLYLRESILRWISHSPYTETVSKIIGSSSKYYSGSYNNMNNGLISDAYANFGFIGIIIYPIIMVLLLNWFTKKIEVFEDSIQYVIIAFSALYLTSTSPFGWLMTGGALLAVFIAIYYRERHIFFERLKTQKEDMILKKENEMIGNNNK